MSIARHGDDRPALDRTGGIVLAAGFTVALALSCSACGAVARRDEPGPLRLPPGEVAASRPPHASRPSPPSQLSHTSQPSRPSPPSHRPHLSHQGGEREAIVRAWRTSERDYYVAGRLARPGYRQLTESFAPGAPALEPTEAFLDLLYAKDAETPSSYRIGDARVVSVTGHEAVLTGCTYDTGTVYRSTGRRAPGDLGGGAGYVSLVVHLLAVHGRWLVWSVQTSTPSSDKEPGPCHGF